MDLKDLKNILLVEDDADTARLQIRHLETFHYQVHWISRGEDAVEYVYRNANSIDLILMDIDLGKGMDGTKVAELILEKYDLPIIFLSSHTEPDIVARTESITSYGYVVKNTGITVLDASIKMAFKLFREKQLVRQQSHELEHINKDLEKSQVEILARDKALQESEERYRRAVAGTNDGLWDLDCRSNETFFSDRFAAMLGFDPEEIKPNIEFIISLLDPEDKERFQEHLQKYLDRKIEKYQNTFRMRCKDGSYRWINTRGQAVWDKEGNPLRITAFYTDITEQKLTADALARNEDRLEKIRIAVNDGIWDWNIQSGEVFFDRRYYEMAGYQNNEFPHRIEEFEKRLHPKDHSYVMEEARRHISGETERFLVEFRFLKRDGSWLWIQGKGVVVEWDEEKKPSRIVGTHTDISARKNAEKEVERREMELSQIIEAIPLMVFVKDARDLRFIRFNKAGEQLLGRDRDELLGKNDYDFFSKERADFFINHDREVLKSGKILDIAEEVLETPDGEKILHTRKVGITDKKGKAQYLLGVSEDITERKNMEKILRAESQKNRRLLRELQHRTKNSFQILQSMVNLEYSQAYNENNKEIFKNMNTRVRAIADLYTLLYETNSVDRVELAMYFDKIVDTAKALNPQIHFSVNLENCVIPADKAVNIGLVLNELLTNALKYAFRDFAHSAETSPKITIELKKSEANLFISVRDNGQGLPRGFDLKVLKGLGLELVDSIIHHLRGRLDWDRTLRTGTRWFINIPCENAE